MGRHDGNPLAGGEVTLHVEQSADRTTVRFDPWGRCTVHAELDRLALRIEAADEQHLRRIQRIITRDIERFGRREHLSVAWRHRDPPADPATDPPSPRTSHTRPARRALVGTGLVTGLLAVVVLVGVHLGPRQRRRGMVGLDRGRRTQPRGPRVGRRPCRRPRCGAAPASTPVPPRRQALTRQRTGLNTLASPRASRIPTGDPSTLHEATLPGRGRGCGGPAGQAA
jgi:hypothetical protein